MRRIRRLRTLDINPYSHIHDAIMKTTIDLPDALFEQTKIAAVKRRSTIKDIVIQGLETVLKENGKAESPAGALARLRRGYHLGGKPLTRDEIYAR